MKSSTAVLILSALSPIVKACSVGMPAIIMSVQFATDTTAGTVAEFVVPLYAECDYATIAPPVKAGSVQTVGIAPTMGINAAFPADAFNFTDSKTGLSLDSNSLKSFLDGLTLTGVAVDFNTAMSSVECIIVATDGTTFQFYASEPIELANGALVDIATYQCGIDFLF